MKRFTKQWILAWLAVLCVSSQPVLAQLNCDGVTNMYGIFNLKAPIGSRQTYIATVSYATGAVGAPLGGTFLMPYTVNTGSNYYGSTTLAADPTTSRFFYMNRDFMQKAIFTKTTAGAPVQTGLTAAAIDNQWFVKLGVGTDGNIYSLSTRSKVGTEKYFPMATKMIRFSSCGVANCATATVVEMGQLSISANFWNYAQYNGDLAFVQNGDMYIFASEFDTTASTYTWSRIYRVNAIDFPAVPNPANIIPVQYIGKISGLGAVPGSDTLAISGAAFDGAGNFYLGANDVATGTRPYLFKGTSIGATTTVTQVPGFTPILAGYTITDLASCVYPNLVILPNLQFHLQGEKKSPNNAINLSWQDNMGVNVRAYVVERQLENGDYAPIATVNASEKGADNFFRYTDQMLPYDYGVANYRIKSQLVNGSYSLSNTIAITGNLNKGMRVLKNPFRNSLELEINASKTGPMVIQLLQETGNSVYQKSIQLKRGKNLITISDLPAIPRGVYVVKASSEEMSLSAKVIRQ